MSKRTITLGANIGHDGGCSLCVDGKIVATMQEERITRVKHGRGWLNSFYYCLNKANVNIDEIDQFIFSHYKDINDPTFKKELGILGVKETRVHILDHHLSHASAAYFTSPFNESLIFIYDAQGNNNDTESVYVARGTKIKLIAKNSTNNFEKGIVSTYQSFTAYFGWNQNDAGKTMGLAPYGDPKKYSGYNIFKKDPRGTYSNNFTSHTSEGVEQFCKNNGIDVPSKFMNNPMVYKNMAAWIQSEFERVIISIVGEYQKKTGLKNLCLGGGGALNSVCNTKILRNRNFQKVHIFPAAGDSGQSVGNALWGYFTLCKNISERQIWTSDYRNGEYKDCEILQNLENISSMRDLVVPRSKKFSWIYNKNITIEAAELISLGKIVGWFQMGSEIGPRALGARSILCDARIKNMKKILNDKVKHREGFRPFACSVIRENQKEYFDLSLDSPFMLFVSKVKKNKIRKIPAVVHVDGTCRIQSITRKRNKIYYDLVKRYKDITGVPLILNTSFNLAGEPIVETVFDAVRCFLSTRMDYLIIGNFLVFKKDKY